MADAHPNALEQRIDEMITQLRSKNAGKRREAAYFLGEAAAEDAVAPLVEVYKNDKDARVRAAAAYSLGMYKAVERALKDGDEAEVVTLLTRIEEQNKLGSRANVGRTVIIELGLVLSLVALVVIFMFSADIKGMIFGSTKTREQVVSEAQQAFTLVRNDTRTLQSEFLEVIQNRELGCVAFFNNPPAYQLDPVDARTFRDVATVVDQISVAHGSLTSAKARYDAACNSGASFGATEAQQAFQLLLPALQSLDATELALTQARTAGQSAATAAPVIEPPTSAPVVVETPGMLQGDAQLQPTVAPEVIAEADPKSRLPALYNLIDQVRDPRGAGGLLVQYWTDVQSSGSTTGCDIANPPAVPGNPVTLTDAEIAASPDLRDAVTLIDSGLQALRFGWVNFELACSSRQLSDRVTAELQAARVALSSFDAAEVKLDAVQSAP